MIRDAIKILKEGKCFENAKPRITGQSDTGNVLSLAAKSQCDIIKKVYHDQIILSNISFSNFINQWTLFKYKLFKNMH